MKNNKTKAIRTKIKNIIKKCKASNAHFISNFCRVKHQGAGVIPFKLFSYQKDCLNQFEKHRFNVFTKCRQCGISTLSGAYALWIAMFFKNKTILIISKSDRDAIEFLNKNVKFVYNHLPSWMRSIWKPTQDNEHTLGFSNGSKIVSLPSGPHVMRQYSSSLVIIDEAAFVPHIDEMWTGGQPTLIHGGRCLHGDSLILDKNGHKKISEYKSGVNNNEVMTRSGYKNVKAAYTSGVIEKTREITTKYGHYISGTNDHELKILDVNGNLRWSKISDMKVGDELLLSCANVDSGRDIILNNDLHDLLECTCADVCTISIANMKHKRLPDMLDANLAELLGLIWGDGFIDNYRIGISCDRKYRDLIDYIHKLSIDIFGVNCKDEISDADYSVRIHSKAASLFLKKNNFDKPRGNEITIPDNILKSTNDVKKAFLRGLFEAGGGVSGKQIKLYSNSLELLRQVQTILLSFGIRTAISEYKIKRMGSEIRYELRTKSISHAIKFVDEIGFISDGKNRSARSINGRNHCDRFTNINTLEEFYAKTVGLPAKFRQQILHRIRKRTPSLTVEFVKSSIELYPMLADTTIGYLVTNELFTDTIKDIVESESLVYDIEVDEVHEYIANGFISHNCIVISTSGGIGNWYWRILTDAKDGYNDFNAIEIDWWEMDWVIEYQDINGTIEKVQPTADIRECRTEEEKARYGPYYSPWLEDQYRSLTEKGDDKKFRQEVLRDFLGSGNTVVSRDTILYLRETQSKDFEVIDIVDFINPATGDNHTISFNKSMWIWKQPEEGHIYTVGVDISCGEAHDWSAIQVIDVMTQEQAAELQIKCEPKQLAVMAAYVGYWYNNAMIVPERTGMGIGVCQELTNMSYPNLFKKDMVPTGSNPNPRNSGHVGFNTNPASKPLLNKQLLDFLGRDGIQIYSHRFLKQIETYVYLGPNKTGAEKGSMNDDLVMAFSLSMLGIEYSSKLSQSAILPYMTHQQTRGPAPSEPMIVNDRRAVMPINTHEIIPDKDEAIEEALNNYTNSLISPKEEPAPVKQMPTFFGPISR